jgi:hypothetical protein
MYKLEISPGSLKIRTDNGRVIARLQKAHPHHDEVVLEGGLLVLTVYAKPGYEFTPFTSEGARS